MTLTPPSPLRPQAAAVSTYDAAVGGGGAFETALTDASKLGEGTTYTSSLDSTDAAFSQDVVERLSTEHPFAAIAIAAGYWRGTATAIAHVRECRNTATSWIGACIGGTDFDAGYCRAGHEGPLW